MHISNVPVHAPLNVTIDGSLPGSDYATWIFSMQVRIKQHAQQLGNAVTTQIQQHNKQRTFLDANGPLGGYAP